MEHERWNAYLWAEGFLAATIDEVGTFFNTCQKEERHRLNGANLHPCLISYDDLESLDGPIDALYESALEEADDAQYDTLYRCKRYLKDKEGYKKGEHTPFQLQDNAYIPFRFNKTTNTSKE